MKKLGYHRLQKSRRAGMTLVELAFIIGIIGIIVGGIWGATRNVSSNAKIDHAIDDLNMVVANMRSLYAGQNASFANLNAVHTLNATPTTSPAPLSGSPGADFCYYTPTLVSQGVFPQEMLPGGGTNSANLWDRTTTYSCGVGTAQAALAFNSSNNTVEFVVRYTNVPAENCVKLLMSTSQTGPDTNLQQIIVTALVSGGATTTYLPGTTTCSAGGNCPLPPNTANAALGCPLTGTFAIDWRYTLGE